MINIIQFTISAPSTPSIINAKHGLNSLLVSWRPSPEPVVTGYIIFYENFYGPGGGSVTANKTVTSVVISGLMATTYSITIVATSNTLPSTNSSVTYGSVGIL